MSKPDTSTEHGTGDQGLAGGSVDHPKAHTDVPPAAGAEEPSRPQSLGEGITEEQMKQSGRDQ